MRLFDLLPLAAVTDGDIFSVHGGLSPKLPYIDLLLKIDRMGEIPDDGLMADITWSDPDDNDFSGFRKNSRGAGQVFGRIPVDEFCYNTKIKLITRSHQLVQEGFKWYFPSPESDLPGQLINVWSAPNYAYQSKNTASILKVRFPGRPEFETPTFGDAKDRINKETVTIALDYFA
jgi:diadenosine tetraphosphatase ApaH/serine/threonine PP2A family protein phosphatase